MNTPAKTTHRIGSDVYIRDQDDQTIQFKARVFEIDFGTQEADIGLYPRRWGTFSELHLPDAYRVRVPLSELSLTPHAGTEQMGFEDRLIALGEAAPPWLDHAGHTHQPGCPEPTSVTTVEAPDGTPEFSLAASSAKPVEAAVHTDAPPADTKKDEAPAPKPEKPAKSSKKPPLFTRDEILKQEAVVQAEQEKLRKMLEQAL